MSAWFASFPLDVIKSVAQDTNFKTKKYSIYNIANNILITRGIGGIYRGHFLFSFPFFIKEY